jgi:hypothetical protein
VRQASKIDIGSARWWIELQQARGGGKGGEARTGEERRGEDRRGQERRREDPEAMATPHHQDRTLVWKLKQLNGLVASKILPIGIPEVVAGKGAVSEMGSVC